MCVRVGGNSGARPGGGGQFCILMAVLGTRVYTGDKMTPPSTHTLHQGQCPGPGLVSTVSQGISHQRRWERSPEAEPLPSTGCSATLTVAGRRTLKDAPSQGL